MALQIQTAATGVVRDAHYVIPTGASEPVRTLLTEPQRTNVFLWSQDASQTAWVKTDTTVTANAAISPEGTANADLLVEGTAGTAEMHQNITVASSSRVVHSRFLKRDNHDWVCLQVVDQAAPTTNFVRGWFNLATGAVGGVANGGSGTTAFASIEPFGNGYFRCALFGFFSGLTALRGVSHSASADASTTRVDNARRIEYGRQFEVGDFIRTPSSYILTAGASAIRNADVLYWENASLVPQELTAYARIVDVGPRLGAILHIGAASTLTNPRFAIQNNSGVDGAVALHHNGTTQATTANTGTRVYRDIAEFRAVLQADGAVFLGVSIGSGAETVSATTAANTLAGAFAGTRLYLGNGAAPNSINAYTHVGIFRGTRDRAYCRANTGVV